MTEHVEVERHGAVQIIRMNRPDKKNAITRAMYGKMAAALTAGDADPLVRVHLILGVPGAFSSGNDIADFMTVAKSGFMRWKNSSASGLLTFEPKPLSVSA